jgi:hypothetical protein
MEPHGVVPAFDKAEAGHAGRGLRGEPAAIQLAVVLETDEPTIEEMIDGGCQQQPVFPIQALFVG